MGIVYTSEVMSLLLAGQAPRLAAAVVMEGGQHHAQQGAAIHGLQYSDTIASMQVC